MKNFPEGAIQKLPNYSMAKRAKYYRVAKELGMDFAIIRGRSGMHYLIRVE